MAPFNNVRVLDRPLKPPAPVFPRAATNLAVGIMLGLLLGFAGATGREMLDRTVRTSEDIERELGLAVLGSLPDVTREGSGLNLGYYYGRRRARQKERASGGGAGGADAAGEGARPELLVHTHPKSVAAEAARAIRTNLMFMSPDNPYRCLLVTSAGQPKERRRLLPASRSPSLRRGNPCAWLIVTCENHVSTPCLASATIRASRPPYSSRGSCRRSCSKRKFRIFESCGLAPLRQTLRI